ncbi:MAG: PAS domain S-box protein [Gemmatimonadales bacterium]|nr:MAG: PAS domain S-box protein [Gemmatimonadales bacterium]
MTPAPSVPSPVSGALRLALIYLVVASVWIAFSDTLLVWAMGREPPLAANVAKGIGFVIFTAFLLFDLIRRELRRREELSNQYRLYLDHSPDVMYRYRLDPEPAFEYVSPSVTEVTGYTPEQHYDDPHLGMKVVHPDDRPLLEQMVSGRGRPEGPVELRWVRADGSVLWVEQNNRIRIDDRGHRIMEGSARDITERRRTEDEKRRLRQAVEEVAESILITDPEGIILYANQGASNLTGYPRDELVGRNARILRSDHHPESLFRQMWTLLARGRSWRGRLRNRRKDGTIYTQDTTITPVLDDSDEIRSYVAVGRDVSIEEALRSQLEYAQRVELVGQMAAGAAHDFKNLLGIIRLNAELAGAQGVVTGTPALRQALDEVMTATHRGERLVTRLLSMGAAAELTVEAIEARQFMDSVTASIRTILPPTVELVVRIEPATPALMADRGAVEQILLNLAANGGHAMPEGGRLEIRVEPAHGDDDAPMQPGDTPLWTRITVTDSGLGMAPEVLSRIWEPFFTTRSGKGGTGLGLPMVRLLTERLGGRILLDSSPGRGCEAELILPAASPHDPPFLPQPGAGGGADAGPCEGDGDPAFGNVSNNPASETGTARDVLVVDDDDGLRRVLQRSLERMGHQVTALRRATEALERMEEGWVPDLIVSDIVMPGMNGSVFYERTQQLGIQTPFVFVSGMSVAETPAHPLIGGSVLFLEKPFSVSQFMETINLALEDDPKTVLQGAQSGRSPGP